MPFGISFEPPAPWATLVSGGITMITVLVLAVTIMAQWFLWLVFGTAIWNPWGMILALPVIGAQILMMFIDPARKAASCKVPKM